MKPNAWSQEKEMQSINLKYGSMQRDQIKYVTTCDLQR
jgi:hypothetical protein